MSLEDAKILRDLLNQSLPNDEIPIAQGIREMTQSLSQHQQATPNNPDMLIIPVFGAFGAALGTVADIVPQDVHDAINELLETGQRMILPPLKKGAD